MAEWASSTTTGEAASKAAPYGQRPSSFSRSARAITAKAPSWQIVASTRAIR